jgi:hypothetical protein
VKVLYSNASGLQSCRIIEGFLSRILLVLGLATAALAGAQVAADPTGGEASSHLRDSAFVELTMEKESSPAVESVSTALPENGTLKVLSLESKPCETDPKVVCLRVAARCKLKRSVSNWSKSLVRIIWHDPQGVPGFSASKGFDACRGEPGDRFSIEFPLPPPGFSYSIELP